MTGSFPAGKTYSVDIVEPDRTTNCWTGLAFPVASQEYRSTCGCARIAKMPCHVKLSRGGTTLAVAEFDAKGNAVSEHTLVTLR